MAGLTAKTLSLDVSSCGFPAATSVLVVLRRATSADSFSVIPTDFKVTIDLLTDVTTKLIASTYGSVYEISLFDQDRKVLSRFFIEMPDADALLSGLVKLTSWPSDGRPITLSQLNLRIAAEEQARQQHEDDLLNPHQTTAEQLGLGNVDNTSDEDKPVSIATQTVVDSLDQRIETEEQARQQHEDDLENPHEVTAEQLGLGNVDNTSDADKPVSTATRDAIENLDEQLTADIISIGNDSIGRDNALSNQIVFEQSQREAQDIILFNQIGALANGSARAFLTYAALDAAKASLPVNSFARVTNDPTPANNWLWQWNGTTLTKSARDDLAQANAYADANPLFKPVVVATGQYTNINQVTTSGHHVLTFNSVAAEIVGLPEAKAGFIGVLANGTLITQTYKPSNAGYFYMRTSSAAGVFGSFAKIVGQSYADTLVAVNRQRTLDDILVEGSPNLFNVATVKTGFRLSGSGIVSPVANAKCSDYIAIDGGETYTVSATAKPSGVSFYADRDAVTSLLYSAATTGTQTITAPSGARFMVVNVKRESDGADAVNLKIEKGSTATAYTAYDAKSVLRQTTLPENVVTTETALAASVKPYDIVTASRNLFAESNVVMNSYLTNAGSISGSAGWARSGMIPVTAGQTYTLSGTRGRQGLAWFAASTDIAAISYVSTSTLPATVTAPAGANFVSFNLQSSTAVGWSNIQFETGSVATKYIPLGQVEYRIDGRSIDNAPSPTVAALGTFTGGATSQAIRGVQGADAIVHTVVINQAPSHDLSRVFNWISTTLNGLALHVCGDDAAPYRLNETTLGANHGYNRSRLTAAAHGKTFIDVGSVWVDGASKQWVLAVIDSTGTLSFTARTDNTGIVAASGTLTHVSGATNTASVSWTATSQEQWYPMLKNHTVSVTADGKPIDPASTTPVQFEQLMIAQSYELMTKPAMVEWLIARTKTNTDITEYSAASNVSVSMAYVFDKYGNCTFATDILALDTVALNTASAGVMFQQTARLTPALDGNVLYYMPKALPVTHESVTYDFAAKANVSSFAPSTRLDMTPARVESGKTLDRVVQLSDNWGYASGYLPILSASPTIRLTLADRKSLQLNNSGAKLYFSGVDSAAITSMAAGDYYSVICYRNYFRRPTARTNNYAVCSGQGDYYYMDWHVATTDRVPLPPELHGRAFTVVEKSDSVTVLSQTATSSVACKTTGAGYAVLLFV